MYGFFSVRSTPSGAIHLFEDVEMVIFINVIECITHINVLCVNDARKIDFFYTSVFVCDS